MTLFAKLSNSNQYPADEVGYDTLKAGKEYAKRIQDENESTN